MKNTDGGSFDENSLFVGVLLGLLTGLFYVTLFGKDFGSLASFAFGIIILIVIIINVSNGRNKNEK